MLTHSALVRDGDPFCLPAMRVQSQPTATRQLKTVRQSKTLREMETQLSTTTQLLEVDELLDAEISANTFIHIRINIHTHNHCIHYP